jgi:uncharacterized membrane protein YcaP (DUF421 family)
VLLFVVGDLVQQSITQTDTSVTAAVLAVGTIAILILVQSYLVFRWKRTRPVLEGTPLVIVHEGRVIRPAIRRQRMTEDDVKAGALVRDMSSDARGSAARNGVGSSHRACDRRWPWTRSR